MPTLPPVSRAYSAFARAGLLTPCTWRAQLGGAAVGPVEVDYRTPQAQVLPGEGAIADEPTAQWPLGTFPGAKQGDLLTFATQSGSVLHTITKLHSVGDGQEMRAELGPWYA